VGRPTVFVRFGGCNLRCPGWPCDTPHAIDPAFRKEWKLQEPEQVWEEIAEVAGRRETPDYTVCFTGGEPFLQQHRDLERLVELLKSQGNSIECFSNGTLLYPDWTFGLVQFIMDWKLPGSGEWSETANLVRLKNLELLARGSTIKFTIASREDYEFAKDIYNQYIIHGLYDYTVHYGVVWGQLANAKLIKWVLEDELPWYFNMQIHNVVWVRSQRGI
jgi:7-carboxy-7-deazaguanine synthase